MSIAVRTSRSTPSILLSKRRISETISARRPSISTVSRWSMLSTLLSRASTLMLRPASTASAYWSRRRISAKSVPVTAMATPEYTAPSCTDRRRGLRSVPHRRKEPSMIYEIRTYRIAPGSLAEVEKRYAEAYEYRKKSSELTAFWHTEIGPLNEIVHVWGYKDLAERARLRGA